MKIEINNQRYYETPYGRLPSSTTILSLLNKPALLNWAIKTTVNYIGKHLADIQNRLTEEEAIRILEEAKQEAERIKIEAGNIGSEVHKWVESYIKELLKKNKTIPNIPSNIEKPIQAFLSWKKQYQFKPLQSEQSVYWYSHKRKIGYAGTLDIIGIIKNKKYIIDIKTSSNIYPEMKLQVASYKSAYNQMQYPKKVRGGGILKLDKITGMPEWVDITDSYKQDRKAFLHLVGFWWLTR
ncbi:MAG: hypothetical protein AB1397_01775 [bacterium]